MMVFNSIRLPRLHSALHFCIVCLVPFRCPSFIRSFACTSSSDGWVVRYVSLWSVATVSCPPRCLVTCHVGHQIPSPVDPHKNTASSTKISMKRGRFRDRSVSIGGRVGRISWGDQGPRSRSTRPKDIDQTRKISMRPLSDPIAPVPADTSGSRGLPSSAPIALFPLLPRSPPVRLIPLGPRSCEDRCLLSKRMAIGLARVESDDCNARLVRHFGFTEAPAAKGGKGWWDKKRGRKCSRKDACSAEPKRVGSVPRHVTERRVQIRTTHVRLRPSRSFQWVGSAKEVGEGEERKREE